MPTPHVAPVGVQIPAITRQAEVEGDRRAATHVHAPALQVEALDLGVVEARRGEARERSEADVALVVVVEARDVARQHARVGGVHVPGEEGQAQARYRTPAEAAEHGDVGVAATDQHQVLDDRRARSAHEAPPIRSGAMVPKAGVMPQPPAPPGSSIAAQVARKRCTLKRACGSVQTASGWNPAWAAILWNSSMPYL